jgi:aldehyde dehydrogenase (NAD+)
MATALTPRFHASQPYGFMIAGEEVAAGDGFDAIDPSTGRVWARVGEPSETSVERAVDAARRAFRTWRRSMLSERQELLWRIAARSR